MTKVPLRSEAITAKLLRRAARCPQEIAFYIDRHAVSIGELMDRAVSISRFLTDRPFASRTLAVLGENTESFISAFLGANLCHLNVQVLDPLWPKERVERVLSASRPDLLLTDRTNIHYTPVHSITDIPEEASDPKKFIALAEQHSNAHESDRAFYTGFTSGSSGMPKGFLRSEQSWLESFHLDGEEFSFDPSDIFICPGNLAHSLFFYALLRGLFLGAPVMLFSTFRPRQIVRELQGLHRAVIFAVPTQLQALLDAAKHLDITLRGIRLLLSSGAKLPKALRLPLKEVFTNAALAEFYGSSELSYISVAKEEENTPDCSVGRVFRGVDVKILDTEFSEMPANRAGTIYIKSPLRFLEYAAREAGDLPEMQLWKDYCSCGDRGYLDERGFLYITGRNDRMMICSGRNIHPEEIEGVLQDYPGILQAAVIAVADVLRGHKPAAVLQVGEGVEVNRSALIGYCSERLPEYFVPKLYYKTDKWPMTVSHKTDFQVLERRLSEGRLRRLP